MSTVEAQEPIPTEIIPETSVEKPEKSKKTIDDFHLPIAMIVRMLKSSSMTENTAFSKDARLAYQRACKSTFALTNRYLYIYPIAQALSLLIILPMALMI
jgi:hypothetical protein